MLVRDRARERERREGDDCLRKCQALSFELVSRKHPIATHMYSTAPRTPSCTKVHSHSGLSIECHIHSLFRPFFPSACIAVCDARSSAAPSAIIAARCCGSAAACRTNPKMSCESRVRTALLETRETSK